jgi:putative endonuclease
VLGVSETFTSVDRIASPWHVYILRCADGTLYTGITTDPCRRVEQHNAGVGARYTAARGPVTLAYCETAPDRSSAARRESAIKKLGRAEKLDLIALHNRG